MNAELKSALVVLAEGQAKTNERLDGLELGQQRLATNTGARFDKIDERFDKIDERFDKIDEQLGRAAGLLNTLAGEVHDLAKRQGRTEVALESQTKRVDAFNETVMRGFTDAAARDHGLERRVDELEARLAALEQAAHT